MKNALVNLVNISKSFDNQMVLDDLNLYIRENEFLTLLGPSASMAQHSTAARRASTRRTVALSAAEAKVWARPVFFAMGNAATA